MSQKLTFTVVLESERDQSRRVGYVTVPAAEALEAYEGVGAIRDTHSVTDLLASYPVISPTGTIEGVEWRVYDWWLGTDPEPET